MTREFYGCSGAVLWLPRVLAAAVVVASMLAAFRLEMSQGASLAKPIQGGVIVVGAFIGLWILRAGSEVRLRMHFDGPRLFFSLGRQSAAVELDAIVRLAREAPFGASRRLLPAAVLIEQNGRPWRLPVVLDHGAELIDDLLERSGRSDLAAWAEILELKQHMQRKQTVIVVGYSVALLVVLAGWLFYVR